MRRVSRDWCLPLSANATKSCRAKPQKGATHRTKQRHAVLCTAGSASAELLPPGCGTLPKLYIGSQGDWESSQKSTKNGCKQRHRIQLTGFLKWLEEASLHTYLILASPQASASGHCWGRVILSQVNHKPEPVLPLLHSCHYWRKWRNFNWS